jgi:hypothetical protein
MANVSPPRIAEPLLLEMMRTFVVMADTLNVSHSQRILGCTRQTIKRHIDVLEKHRGCKLFRVEDKKYALTKTGHDAVDPAQNLLRTAQEWVLGLPSPTSSIQKHSHFNNSQQYTYLEQKGLSDLFSASTPFLKDCLKSWLDADGNLMDLEPLRAFGMVFRQDTKGWIIVEVGERAASADWFGSQWRMSVIGKRVNDLPASDQLAPISNSAYKTISSYQSIRLDHISTIFPKDGRPFPVPVSYKRLTLATQFPDGTPALLSIAERTHDVRIDGLPEGLRLAMPDSLIMDARL